jgi:DNA-binding transcriptional regulator YdaS (Cro superfamily)
MKPQSRTHRRPTVGLKAAIEAVGSARELARLLSITHQAIAQWERVPAERMLEIERVTGIARERLRPELYRIPAECL